MLAAAESIAIVVGGIVPEADLLLSGLDAFASKGVRLPALGGMSRDTESIDGLGPGVLFIWFLDGGLSLGKREKAPPCGGPADMVLYFLSQMEKWDRGSLLQLLLPLFSSLSSKRALKLSWSSGVQKSKISPLHYRRMFAGWWYNTSHTLLENCNHSLANRKKIRASV